MTSPQARPIAVVDDDADIRDALVDTLKDEGYRAVGFADGPGLLTWLGANAAPSVVLLDWNMRPMNGPAVMRELGKQPDWSSIPVLLITADVRADEKVKAERFVGCLRKPVNVTDLLSTIRKYAVSR